MTLLFRLQRSTPNVKMQRIAAGESLTSSKSILRTIAKRLSKKFKFFRALSLNCQIISILENKLSKYYVKMMNQLLIIKTICLRIIFMKKISIQINNWCKKEMMWQMKKSNKLIFNQLMIFSNLSGGFNQIHNLFSNTFFSRK